MSKIEKALRKARESGESTSRTLVRTKAASESESRQPGKNPERADAAVIDNENSAANLVSRTESAASIVFMQQPQSLDIQDRMAKKIIYPEASENATIRALREIRTKVMQKSENANCVIMVTGTSLGSGASFLSVNLAAAIALDAARTSLAIDCNIRDPSMHRLVSGEIRSGLTNYLINSSIDIADIILPTGINRLRVIPAGVDIDPTVEYFTMDRMRRLIRSVRERYPDRNIILDCPPIAHSADTQILLELCDYVVLVVPYARATPARLQSALKLIDSRKLLGVVLNQEPGLPSMEWKNTFLTIIVEQASGVLRRIMNVWANLRQRMNRRQARKPD